MGNSKSKKPQKEPDKFFEREKWKEQKREESRKKALSSSKKRHAAKEPAISQIEARGHSAGPPLPNLMSPSSRSYDDEALDRMRYQLNNDSDAFLLNNILLSIQFFENYEREMHNLKTSPVSEQDHEVNDAVVRHNKHVFLPDKLHECVHGHVRYWHSKDKSESLSPLRMFVIYDNIEVCEPGDTSDYSAVLDAPFYKMMIEETKEPGYAKLRQLEVLENIKQEKSADRAKKGTIRKSDVSDYTDSEKESTNSDDDQSYQGYSHGEALLRKLKSKIDLGKIAESPSNDKIIIDTEVNINDLNGRRRSGPIKSLSKAAIRSNISNLSKFRKNNLALADEIDTKELEKSDDEIKKSNNIGNRPKQTGTRSHFNNGSKGHVKNSLQTKKNDLGGKSPSQDVTLAEDTETSGYRTNSSPQNDSSETDSDYGYATITESSTPKPLELSVSRPSIFMSSGALLENWWVPVNVRKTGHWSDDEDSDSSSKDSFKKLYDTYLYLNSVFFMSGFVDSFLLKIGSELGFTPEYINSALTQGASIYSDSQKGKDKVTYEIIPAVVSSWPNAANEWIIRERRIIQNPRTNFSYQWPTKYMVSKATDFGCILIPVGYRPKRGANPDQKLQWRIVFPAAERYLESCLAHSHVRCYMFTLTLIKKFLENESSKIGVDASHIRNHLFWECEDNYAKWPEDRLGETLRIFLKSLYKRFGQARFPNYFMDSCNDFKCIPKTILLKQQRRLADILESPVMHLLSTIRHLKYVKKDFYPKFDSLRLYNILTSKNVLKLINPNIAVMRTENTETSSESEDEQKDDGMSFWEKSKSQDKQYLWKKERQKQVQERRKAVMMAKKKQKALTAQSIDKNVILPARMEPERRRLILEFFIPHFIAMASASEKYQAIRQAIVYLEQALRLSIILEEEPGGDLVADEFKEKIRVKLSECKKKLANQASMKSAKQNENISIPARNRNLPTRLRVNGLNISSQDSPPLPSPGTDSFTFVDIHNVNNRPKATIKLEKNNETDSEEESKL